MNGLRSGLDYKETAGTHFDSVTILGPFDIHGLAVMFFNDTCPLSQFKDFIVTQNIITAFFRGGFNIFYRLISIRIIVVYHLYFFTADSFPDNGTLALLQGRLENIILVRIYSTLNDVLTQPPGSGKKNGIFKTAFSINGEYNAGR